MPVLIGSIIICVIGFVISYFTNDEFGLTEDSIDLLWNLFFANKDFLAVFFCVALYLDCSFRNYRKKIPYTILVGFWSGIFIHNRLIQFDILNDYISIFYSMALIIILTIGAFSTYSIRWDNLPNDKIEPGYIYEIIGKPRGGWQLLLYVLLAGRGGSFAITDGTTCIYMNKTAKKSVKEPLSPGYRTGKKCVKLCEATDQNIYTYRLKVGLPFSFWQNCYRLTRGFK